MNRSLLADFRSVFLDICVAHTHTHTYTHIYIYTATAALFCFKSVRTILSLCFVLVVLFLLFFQAEGILVFSHTCMYMCHMYHLNRMSIYYSKNNRIVPCRCLPLPSYCQNHYSKNNRIVPCRCLPPPSHCQYHKKAILS